MKVVVNALPFRSSHHGVGRYIRNLLSSLLHIDSDNTYIVYASPDGVERLVDHRPPNLELRTLDLPRPLRIVWEHLMLPSILRRENADVYFGMAHVLPLHHTVSQVVTVHDMSWYVVPEMHQWIKGFYFRWMIPQSLRKASLVFVDSRATRDDVVRILGVPASRIVVTLLGVDQHFRPHSPEEIRSATDRLGLGRRYILHFGVREPRKNLHGLLQAYLTILDRNPAFPYDLVLGGEVSYGWKNRDADQLLRDARLRGRVRVLGAVPDELLPALVAGASLFVFPSFYEGFGLPVLEAMASGTPVVTTRVASLPEVCGEAARYVDDPRDARGISRAIEDVLSDEVLRRFMRDEGIRRSREFTWRRCAEATLLGLKRAYGGDRSAEGCASRR